MENGVRYAYTGNVFNPEGDTTCCHECGKVIIGRSGYSLTAWSVVRGRCAYCGTRCAGVFDKDHGTWGSRRLPVRLRDFVA